MKVNGRPRSFGPARFSLTMTLKPYNLKTYGFRAFSVIAPILWNDLPIDIRSIDDVNKFKCKLKTFLFKRVYELS